MKISCSLIAFCFFLTIHLIFCHAFIHLQVFLKMHRRGQCESTAVLRYSELNSYQRGRAELVWHDCRVKHRKQCKSLSAYYKAAVVILPWLNSSFMPSVNEKHHTAAIS